MTRMMLVAITICVSHAWSAVAGAEQPPAVEPPAVTPPTADPTLTPPAIDFDTEVMPIFSKAGCNAAACHGGASGQGGFRLSLFGGDADFDFDAIVRQREGRRLHWLDPIRSLLLAKPLAHLDHGGGQRLNESSEMTETLQRWIAQGATRQRLRRLVQLNVEPSHSVVPSLPFTVTLKVTATFDDGTVRTVNDLAVIESTDREAVVVDTRGGVQVLRTGQHTVLVRFLELIVPVQLLAPIGQETTEGAHREVDHAHLVDYWIDAKLRQLRLAAAPPADDSTFLRRLTLDLTGRLPNPEQVAAAAKHPESSETRRERRGQWIAALLKSEAFVDYWTYQLATLLRVRTTGNDEQAVDAFHQWLRAQVADGAAWKRIVAEMLSARGDTLQNPAANFHRLTDSAPAQAEYVAEVLMGVRIRCANCHRHPLDRWTQDDYHGLAQVFAKLERGSVIEENEHGEIIHPKTGKPAVPRLPGDRDLSDAEPLVAQFTAWLTSDENPYFARAFVGQVWQRLMGRGLVDPPDDLRSTNPATHPELLDALTDDFIQHHYDLRHLIQRIVTSDAYARATISSAANQPGERYYAWRLARPLSAEVLADAISDVTGVVTGWDSMRPDLRAVQLPDPSRAADQLDVLGRCERGQACDAAASGVSGVAAQLSLLNGPILNDRLLAADGRVQRMIRETQRADDIVRQFYVLALSRYPTSEEREFWSAEIDSAENQAARHARIVDFVWSLLTCHAFTHNR